MEGGQIMPVQIDMDMPNSCRFCPLQFKHGDKPFCCITLDAINPDRFSRDINCPLKEVKE